MMALADTRLPQEALDLMVGWSADELIKRNALWLPTDRASSKDKFLTDLRIGHERVIFPVYFDRFPSSEAVADRGGVRIQIPEALLEGGERPPSAAQWTRALLRLTKLPQHDAERALLDLPEIFPPSENSKIIEVRLFEISEIGKPVLHPALLVRGE